MKWYLNQIVGAVGYALSFRGNAKYEWQSRRLIHRASKAAERAGEGMVKMESNDDLKNLINSDKGLNNLKNHFDQSTDIDVGQVQQASPDGTSIGHNVNNLRLGKCPSNHKVSIIDKNFPILPLPQAKL